MCDNVTIPYQYTHTLGLPLASGIPALFIRAYQNLRTRDIIATTKLQAAHVKFPVG